MESLLSSNTYTSKAQRCQTGHRKRNGKQKWINFNIEGKNWNKRKADGSQYYPSYPTYKLQKVLKKHNLPHIRWHDLRHTTASLLILKGWQMKEISDWLGHADISTTMNIYGHIGLEHKRKLGKSIGGMF